jgi:hypothetical protein
MNHLANLSAFINFDFNRRRHGSSSSILSIHTYERSWLLRPQQLQCTEPEANRTVMIANTTFRALRYLDLNISDVVVHCFKVCAAGFELCADDPFFVITLSYIFREQQIVTV